MAAPQELVKEIAAEISDSKPEKSKSSKMKKSGVIYGPGGDVGFDGFNDWGGVEDAVRIAAGQHVSNEAAGHYLEIDFDAARQALRAARENEKIDNAKAYIKVGTVGKDLVFRVKYDAGRWKKGASQDGVIVADWQATVKEIQQRFDNAYLELRSGIQNAIVDVLENNVGRSLDSLALAIDAANLNEANKQVTNARKNYNRCVNALKASAMEQSQQVAAGHFELRPEDLDLGRVANEIATARRLVEELGERLNELDQAADVLEEQLLAATENLETAEVDEAYREKLRQVLAGYKEVVATQRAILDIVSHLKQEAAPLVELAESPDHDEQVVDSARQLITPSKDQEDASEAAGYRFRNKDGDLVIRRDDDDPKPINDDDKNKILEPHFTASIKVHQKITSARKETHALCKLALRRVVERDNTNQAAQELLANLDT